MVISLSTSGIKCQLGDFVMLVDPPASAKAAADKKTSMDKVSRGNLILKTSINSPIAFPVAGEVVACPGEYEIGGVRVRGVGVEDATSQLLKIVYLVEIEGIRLAFLGKLQRQPAEETLDKLGEVDLLFLSVDPNKLSPKQLTVLIKQVDPKFIIPLDDKTARLLAEGLGQKAKLEDKLVIKKKDLLSREAVSKLVWLKSSIKEVK